MVTFSFVVPVYNVRSYLSMAVDSVLGQTFDDLELILVDDGSTDGSGAICDEYLEKDARVRVIHKENGGLSSARNAGIEAAEGAYIIFLDSDDCVDTTLCQTAWSILKAEAPDVVQYRFVPFPDGETPFAEKSEEREIFCGDDVFAGYVNERITREAWNKVYRRELFEDIRYPVGRLAEDLATTYLILEKCQKVVCLEACLYHYRVRNNSIMTTGSDKLFYDAMLAHEEVYRHNRRPAFSKRLYSNYYNNLIKLCAKQTVEGKDTYAEETTRRLKAIRSGQLETKSKLIYWMYTISPKRTLRLVYRRFIQRG